MGAVINGVWVAAWPEDPSTGSVPPGELTLDEFRERFPVGDNPTQRPDHDCTSPLNRNPDTDACRRCEPQLGET